MQLIVFTVEDQKDLPSAVNPELRHKEVQMNFFNQLTSVFNPDLTSILASPSSAHMQVTGPSSLGYSWDQIMLNEIPPNVFKLYYDVVLCCPFLGWEWWCWPNHRSSCAGQNEKCLCLSECVKPSGTRWVRISLSQVICWPESLSFFQQSFRSLYFCRRLYGKVLFFRKRVFFLEFLLIFFPFFSFFHVFRWVWEVTTSVPQPALLPTLHQPVSRCCLSQLFLYHARHSGGCHCCPQWVFKHFLSYLVISIVALFFSIEESSLLPAANLLDFEWISKTVF